MENLPNLNQENISKIKTSRSRVLFWLVCVIIILFCGVLVCGYLYIKHFSYNYNITIPQGDNQNIPFKYGVTPALANADYYNRVLTELINQKTNFIEANLSTMELRLYSNGVVSKEVKIATKGRPGSWWETPAGLYKVEAMEPNHFSLIGKVYQPWSMVFQGNFFIHGWPYYPDGTPVATTYSGGCIRLATDDAKSIYDMAKVGMPVLVYADNFSSDTFQYTTKQPVVSAKEFLVADLKSNSVLTSKDITSIVPIASVTKLVTSLVAAEYINLDKPITITKSMIVPTSKSRLYEGQEITVYNLLFPLLLESSNEAAQAIAQKLGSSYFIGLMNQKAKAINMNNTHFVDPSGSDSGGTSTAEDLFSLAKYIFSNRRFVFNISSGKLKSSDYGDSFYSDLGNFNLIPNTTAGFIGGKIGKTGAAGETYVGAFNEKINGEDRPIAIIVLGSTDAYADTQSLLSYVEGLYFSSGTSNPR